MESTLAALSWPCPLLEILVVDAVTDVRRSLRQALGLEGHNVYEASDGLLAVKLFKSIRPNLVLLEMILPKQDGLCALNEIRAFDTMAGVIVMSTLSPKCLMIRSTSSTADAYLQKPFSLKILQMHIRLVMSKVILRQHDSARQAFYGQEFHPEYNSPTL
jgi:two-component system chemotaxis response regulator CheY